VVSHLGGDVLAIEPWAGGTDARSEHQTVPSPDTLSAIEGMSEDDVARLLASRLAGEVAS